MALYEKRFKQIEQSVNATWDQKSQQSVDSGNLFAFTYEILSKDTAKRMLLDQCFFEIQGQRIKKSKADQVIMNKIKELLKDRNSYPDGGIFIDRGEIFIYEQY